MDILPRVQDDWQRNRTARLQRPDVGKFDQVDRTLPFGVL
jgi:hypothetical protein